MTTLAEDLQRIVAILRAVTKHDIGVAQGAVYVNFDYHAAVVVEPELSPGGKRYICCVYAWDRTGGVSDEVPLGDGGLVTLSELPGVVKAFLDEQDENARKLEEMLDTAFPE